MKRVANPAIIAEKTIKSFLREATYAAVDDRRKSRENDGKFDRITATFETYANVVAEKSVRVSGKKEWIKYNPRQIQILRMIMESYVADVLAANITDSSREHVASALDEIDSASIFIVSEFYPSGLLVSYHDNQKLSSLIINKLPKYAAQVALSASLAEYFTTFLKRIAHTMVMFCWDEVHTCTSDGVFGPMLQMFGLRANILDTYEESLRPVAPKKKKAAT